MAALPPMVENFRRAPDWLPLGLRGWKSLRSNAYLNCRKIRRTNGAAYITHSHDWACHSDRCPIMEGISPFIYKMQFYIAGKNLNHNGFYATRSCIFLWSPFSSKYIDFFVTSGYVMREPEALLWATCALDCRPVFLALFEVKLTLIFILYF